MMEMKERESGRGGQWVSERGGELTLRKYGRERGQLRQREKRDKNRERRGTEKKR